MIAIAAGGTGGHMLPGLAIADAIRRERPDMPICFIGAGREMEGSLVEGYTVYRTGVKTFSSGLKGRLAPLSVIPAIGQARGILKRIGARAVVGMGGYPSLPVVYAARSRGLRAVLHEQNAVPGLANAACAKVTKHIAVSFAPAMEAFGSRKPRLVGLPIRSSVASLADPAVRAAARREAYGHFGLDPYRSTLIVVGGSLGARALNRAAIDLAVMTADRTDLQILLACGRNDHDEVIERSRGASNLHVHAFIDRMDLAYAVADVAVTRGGASTVAELAATGTPSVIVPLPVARRKEQDANAAVLASVGGAKVIADPSLSGDVLMSQIASIIADPALRRTMSEAALSQARPTAARDMAAFVLEVLDAA